MKKVQENSKECPVPGNLCTRTVRKWARRTMLLPVEFSFEHSLVITAYAAPRAVWPTNWVTARGKLASVDFFTDYCLLGHQCFYEVCPGRGTCFHIITCMQKFSRGWNSSFYWSQALCAARYTASKSNTFRFGRVARRAQFDRPYWNLCTDAAQCDRALSFSSRWRGRPLQ